MGVTPVFAFPWPELTGVEPDGPDAIGDLAARFETVMAGSGMQTYTPAWTAAGSVQPSNPSSIIGMYSVDRGLCSVAVALAYGASTDGGRGDLRIGLPVPAHPDIPEQLLTCRHTAWTLATQTYTIGVALIHPAAPLRADPLFAVESTETIIHYWQDKETNGAGPSIPEMSSGFLVVNGGSFTMTGTYFTEDA